MQTFIKPDNFSTTLFLVVVAGVLFVFLRNLWICLKKTQANPQQHFLSILVGLFAYLTIISVIGYTALLQAQPMPRLVVFFAVVNLISFAFAFTSVGTLLSEQITIHWLVLFHVFRLPLEFAIHLWVKQGSVPGTMTWTGQNYDLVTGVLAIAAVVFSRKSIKFIWAFNIIGTALLLNVMRVALFSSPLPFAWRLDPYLQLAFHFPYILIVPVCVGGALAAHIILFRALFRKLR